METKGNHELLVKMDEDTAHICYYGNCVTCRRFDPNYHGGYCDYHKIDTNPDSSCRDYWER